MQSSIVLTVFYDVIQHSAAEVLDHDLGELGLQELSPLPYRSTNCSRIAALNKKINLLLYSIG
jgi:hypothetical protein